jgi:hypothetical protein
VSTTFEVYPGTAVLPTFDALLERSTAELHAFLGSLGLAARPRVEVRLQRNADDSAVSFDARGPLRWDKGAYAWFTVGGVSGGTDAYFDDDKKKIAERWEDIGDPKCERLGPLLRQCLAAGHYWSFRRSAGQPAAINLAYGLIAGSLASLTGGFVYSDDSAWDWERMPALPQDFLSFYFRPELALEDAFREWSGRCIDQLRASEAL